MRCLLSTLALSMIVAGFVGCRSQSPTMTNPFLAPDRVPPPSTRALMPGTAQPYYGEAPVPNTPIIGQPPAGAAPVAPLQSAPATFSPQPAGTVPPGGWNTTPQAFPPQGATGGYLPNNPATVVQIQPDQHSLRFDPSTQSYQAPTFVSGGASNLPPDPSILPTPEYPQQQQQFAVQQASYQMSAAAQPVVQQAVPVSDPREVRIRAISSDDITADGQARFRDGFRPQGTSQVRKPMIPEQYAPQPTEQPQASADRFGHDANYQWIRGQLHRAPESGQWSLRYTPGDNAADAFGGNLPIANPQVLGPLQAGEFVQLRGSLDRPSLVGGGSTSVYRVSVVQRQRI